ncbi:hypothetical protein M0208_12515 [Sphingomonas sp. SUN019]|uniref:DUF7927 domain-containing protein n=1 Tax=Sphingomonas sp. SUN019 TaxID=2937788 RepID=UPI0021644AA9|nr:hypothetical protein [Sphingomonas sp. SUN019]UVO51293.1 hypothetical protein M0208_12515 [Sphingomonas sp. SUN019]
MIRPILHRLLALLILSCIAVGQPALASSQVVNVAQATWDVAGGTTSLPSNVVVLPVEQAPTATLTAYHPGGITSPRAPVCHRADGGSLPILLPAPPGTTPIDPAPATAIRAGETLLFKLVARFANRDAAAVDSFNAVIVTTHGDREVLTIFETGVDTGEFVGAIPTRAVPPAVVPGDCALSLLPDDQVSIECQKTGDQHPIVSTSLDVLIDPYGLVFDSEDGTPVSGARVTMIDAATGQPARVFAPDGTTPWPSTVVTGETVIDGAGNRYPLPPGEYRFPLAARGNYRLQVAPPAPYSAPSKATAAQLVGLTRPDGEPLTIDPASYGGSFLLSDPAPVRIDVPLDRPAVAVSVSKTASRGTASPGDAVLYTVTAHNPDGAHAKRGVTLTDILPPAMRLRSGTIRVDGQPDSQAVTVATDGRRITIALGTLAPAATRTVTYALEVRPDAREGEAMNRATAVDARGRESVASVAVRITRETIAARMTIVGRIVDAACEARAPFLRGVAGVRVLLEDGSYAVTDRDGRYHFEGVVPGTHVVKIDAAGSPAWSFVDCARSTRSAGSATSRFVEGQGGTLAAADFHAVPSGRAVIQDAVTVALSDRDAAGAERDWFAGGGPNIAWLFPEADHNPRSPAIRVAIRHLPNQKIRLLANGRAVDPITLDGTRNDPTNSFAVTLWRGVPLTGAATTLIAEVVGADGKIVETLTRRVAFIASAARAEFVAARSVLVADGVQRPVIAVRMLDRAGRPVHHGVVGEFALPAPYEAAVAVDAEQARMLSGVDRAAPSWRVDGDDGVALIALSPTTISGALTLQLQFRDGDQTRVQTIDTWLSPGNQPWTIVGLAEGRIGHHALADKVEPLAAAAGDLEASGRVALYAKGRVRGDWLLTFAYDSAKRRAEQGLTGAIDPNAYYTVYADRSERRYDAASTRKLYLKLEQRQFYALFGDFVTGFGDTVLGRYVRAGTGAKTELRHGQITASAFGARFETHHRRDEIQGNGLSGPYALSASGVAANSEQVAIEVRDRTRSERIVERRTLTRFVDYDMDYAAGTVRFSAPVLTRTSALDPQFIIVDYELYAAAGGAVSGGARATWSSKDRALRIGATVLSDAGEDRRTSIAAADVRLRVGAGTEVRAEIAASRARGATDAAWLVEAEHHDARVDLLAYARQQDAAYGVAQQNAAERGRRKMGVDARVRITDALSASGSAWIDDDLSGDAQRRAVRARAEYRHGSTNLRLGVVHAEDRTTEATNTSTLLEAGASRAVLDGRVTLDASTSIALGSADSADFPAQHRVGARFAVTPDVTLIGGYEIASGGAVDARTARIGFDVKPWNGARLTSSVGDQQIAEYGRRAFAAYGLAQSLQLDAHWTVDATLDGNRTLNGISVADVVNPAHPVASGGFVGGGSTLTEDFTAITLGGTYRATLWSATARVERRFAADEDRAGATLGVIRQLGEGVFGALATWTQAARDGGAQSTTLDIAVSGAYRPASSRLAALGKVAWIADSVTGAVAGVAGPIGSIPLSITGDAVSRRLVASMSLDWAPYGRDADGLYQRDEFGLFIGTRYVFDRIDGLDVAGLSTLIGCDARVGLGDRFEFGLTGTLRGDLARGSFGYAFGPSVGFRPARDVLIGGGWNVHGFADRDFAAARQTRQGPYVTARMKFDEGSLAFLGLTK